MSSMFPPYWGVIQLLKERETKNINELMAVFCFEFSIDMMNAFDPDYRVLRILTSSPPYNRYKYPVFN